MKTDLELQKLLAEELLELLFIYQNPQFAHFTIHWKQPFPPNNDINNARVTDREWLWIVAECEKSLNIVINGENYYRELQRLIRPYSDTSKFYIPIVMATWQQRATAYFKTIGKL
jgi:hypothetical protein